MRSIERGCVCFQEKYYKVCIARAAVHKNQCEDSTQLSKCTLEEKKFLHL